MTWWRSGTTGHLLIDCNPSMHACMAAGDLAGFRACNISHNKIPVELTIPDLHRLMHGHSRRLRQRKCREQFEAEDVSGWPTFVGNISLDKSMQSMQVQAVYGSCSCLVDQEFEMQDYMQGEHV